jgi:hypothetical protein
MQQPSFQVVSRLEIVKRARAWKETPYHHQAMLRGVGCDCLGLLGGVAKDIGFEIDMPMDYSMYPENYRLKEGMDEQLDSIEKPGVGSVGLFWFMDERYPQHVCIISETADLITDCYMVHSYASKGKVVEHRLGRVWKRRLIQFYDIPGVTN